ncbi:hypothetical protein SEA_GRASSBOY_18 [Microbacterium phage Grassboy]|nr:hypothetical protein SEA_GRASSBOY_18 [Microbacterium phage Grassboy]
MGFGDERSDGGSRPSWLPPEHPEVRRLREISHQRAEERRAAARRTRLYSFGLAGGRRP